MPRTITAAVVQTAAHDRTSLAAAWPMIAGRLRAAASRAQIVVLPEGTLPAYVLGYRPFEDGEIAAALEECAAIAREHRCVVVVGAARRESERTYNSALVIDADGSLAGSADKHFLWHFDRQWFAPGERIEPVQTAVGRIGALVCADGRIPTIARALVDRGAELLVMPTAWVTSGRDPANLENVQADLLARMRARENAVPFLAANKCGVELGCVAYCGKSQIVRADGSIAAIAPQDREETLFADIDVGNPAPPRCSTPPPPPPVSARPVTRIALAVHTPQRDAAELLRMLEADALLTLDDTAGVALVADDAILDPGALPAFRLGGGDIAVWRTALAEREHVAFARTRALELRMYLAVIDERAGRAYAVDPDGTLVCGTYDGYGVASFTYDPAFTQRTRVAPGTDVLEGLRRAAEHAAS